MCTARSCSPRTTRTRDLFRTVGKCGTGFSDAELAELPARLAPLRRDEKPALVDSRQPADVWFEPGLVLEVLSAELTLSPNATAGWGQLKDDSGLAMRFPRFTGRWRDDKGAAGRDHHDRAGRPLQAGPAPVLTGDSGAVVASGT